LAKLLISQLEKSGKKIKHIDGDGLRELTQNFDYSEKGRVNNIKKAQAIAKQYYNDNFEVVVSVVAPYLYLREEFKKQVPILEFYTHTTQKRERDHFKVNNYEKPLENYTNINTNLSIEVCMTKILETIKNENKHAMFVGRYQPLHDGHKWLFNEQLKENKKILICVRDVIVDKNNPFTAAQVLKNITKHYNAEVLTGNVKVIIIPDIDSINYGRGVGYKIIEHKPPQKIKEISATEIRKNI
jgi:cytidyltransferase-like protein